MASAARAYRYGSAVPAPRHEQAPERNVRVIPGRRHQVEKLDNRLITFAKIGLALLLAFVVLGCVRVSLISSAVQTSLQTSQIESQINTARANGTMMEVEQSKLANPTAVKQAASKLHMAAPTSAETIELAADVVATDEAGNLSLSKSLAVAAKE